MKNSTPAVLPGLLGKWFILTAFDFPTHIRSDHRVLWSAGCGISAFPAVIPDRLKCIPEKTFVAIQLLLHLMLSRFTQPISPVFRGRSCLSLMIHPPIRMTGMNTCNLLLYMACSPTLSNLCLEIAS